MRWILCAKVASLAMGKRCQGIKILQKNKKTAKTLVTFQDRADVLFNLWCERP